MTARMEYRLWITVPDLPFEDEKRWEPFLERLEKTHSSLGPILSWSPSGAALIILGLDAESEARAAQTGFDVVTSALQAGGLANHYPREIEVEPIPEDELAPA
ncbi:MAG: hypothetical protein AABM29_10600 [Actinomycetota bacterium]